MSEDWLARWEQGRIGWHEPGGNAGLKQYWPASANPGSVLVPLCGKSPDLEWLAKQGHDVVGVELSDIAVRSFFEERNLDYDLDASRSLKRYTARNHSLTLYCGDYFGFRSKPFDALYDRGAIVALPGSQRPRYVAHTKTLLKPRAVRLIVTLEYDQRQVDGPPFAVPADEINAYWDDLVRVGEKNDIDNCPPKFRQAGVTEISEVFWLSRR